jgi:glutathione S-transferase
MTLVLHALAPSHPCMTVARALELKGLAFERIDLPPGAHVEEMGKLYGEGNTTVPGLTIDGEPVHGSRAILARLDALAPEPSLFPAERAEAVREAERWGDDQLQDLGRSLTWGALHFRPEALATVAGGEQLDPVGTDFAIRYVRAAWKYHGITAVRLAEDLAGLPAKLDHVDALIADRVIGTDEATAADLQIGATIRVLLILDDLQPLLRGRPLERMARRWFPDYPGRIPAAAFPAGWVPAP